MGFDVTWHPISQVEMHQWYFERLLEARRGNFVTAMKIANQCRMGQAKGDQEQCRRAYKGMLEQGAQVSPNDPFEKTHCYLLAMVQGMFRAYYYTRGGIFSALTELEPEMADYTLPFQEILGSRLRASIGIGPMKGRIYENYCGGVYIPEAQVPRLLADYENGIVDGQLKQCFGNALPVFLKALLHAKKEGLGLLEATEVVEPNPLDLHATVCHSYLTNCDLDGVKLYVETARHQAEEAIRAKGDDPAKVRVARQVVAFPSIPSAEPVRKEPAPAAKAEAAPKAPKAANSQKAPKTPKVQEKKKGLFGRLFGGK